MEQDLLLQLDLRTQIEAKQSEARALQTCRYSAENKSGFLLATDIGLHSLIKDQCSPVG